MKLHEFSETRKVSCRFNKSQWSETVHVFNYCLFSDAVNSWSNI